MTERRSKDDGPGAPLRGRRAPSEQATSGGRTGLTEREREVLLRAARGQSNAEIAAGMLIDEGTVKTHGSRIFTELGLRDRVQAVVYVHENGLVPPGEGIAWNAMPGERPLHGRKRSARPAERRMPWASRGIESRRPASRLLPSSIPRKSCVRGAQPGIAPYIRRVIADEKTRRAIEDLINTTYVAMSTPGSDVAALFGAADIAIAGSGQGELWTGPDEVIAAATAVSSWGLQWTPETITVWQSGDVAWAQILGNVHVLREDVDEHVPYWTTGVFGFDDDRWHWLYWGGSEPQESAKV